MASPPHNLCILFFIVGQLDKHRRINDRLVVAHLLEAFRWILLETQQTSFPGEINALRSQKPPAYNPRISSLSLFLDRQGLLRSRGRLSKPKNLLVVRYPIILDSKHPAVKFFLLQTHKSNSYASLEQSRSVVQDSFGFCVVDLHSRPSTTILFLADE